MKKRSKIIAYILFGIAGIILGFTVYIQTSFSNIPFEQLIYSLIYTEGVNLNALSEGALYCFIGMTLSLLILSVILYLKNHIHQTVLKISWKKHSKDIVLFPLQKILRLSILVVILSLIFCFYKIGAMNYVENQLTNSEFYEAYYVSPDDVKITFPEKKQNLIYIYLEAMESGYVSKENGGDLDKPLIPGLEQLALENLNFSQHDKIGGANVLRNTSWTIAGILAQTSGITLNIPIMQNSYTGYSAFMPGVVSLGEILEDNGYHNYFMIGSDATFGGRRQYLTEHGNYKMLDYPDALETGKVKSEEFVDWGYEDARLFEFAKQELLELAKTEEPFNFTMLTVDTHFPIGWLDKSCKDLPFDTRYQNAHYCSDSKVYNFIRWLQKQDFYEDTTIIISGDHYGTDVVTTATTKRTYNLFINSVATAEHNKYREFATVDMFPTTLAALGASIEGDRLGLGTNLFSSKSTLIEELGFDHINEEIGKNSPYYNARFLKNSYQEMLDKLEQEKEQEETE